MRNLFGVQEQRSESAVISSRTPALHRLQKQSVWCIAAFAVPVHDRVGS